jgi:GNAT superfamily N-acetyltransferase
VQKQTHVSRPETNVTLEGNRVAFFSRMARAPGGALEESSKGIRMSSGVPLNLANWVLRTNCRGAEIRAHIESTVRYFRRLRLPFLWAIGPGDRPANLREELLAAGFSEAWSPAMAVDIDNVARFTRAPELTIKPVSSAAELRIFTQTLNAGDFLASEEIERALPHLLQSSRSVPWDEPDLRCFVGYHDGQPVASSARFLSNGVVGIYGVATVPAARRKGFGAAMTIAALEDGRSLGYGVGVLVATKMGAPVYERLGFREVYRVGEFAPPSEGP